jgi:serine/threonine protein kinase/Tol biopolymer transport system component
VTGGRIRSGLILGPYQVTEVLGEGGMGVVVGAVDTKLLRPVAIKFLSTALADVEARHRFQREAQLASSLNHPHILTVHDVGEFEGQAYLVTEFVDGGTLKDWAAAEPRNWRQIVDLIVGVADGLSAAHQAGILHRDVKPQNVLVAKNGYAKLADFGLAKISEPALADATVAATAVATQRGVVMGTIAYMSPEQATGKALDARSDVFSFGVVLYELLAGRRPFDGTTELEVLQTVIHGTAAPLDVAIPTPLRLIVEKALEKDPADRYQTMRELVIDLRRVARRRPEDSGQVAPQATPTRSARWRRLALAALGCVALVAAGALGAWWLILAPPIPSSTVRFHQITNDIGMEGMPAASPDGRAVAFVAPVNGRRQIWVRLLSGGAALPLTRDDVNHENPRWAPDSSAIVYFTPPATEGESGTLWEIPALGGAPRRLAASTTGADVSHDGRRIAAIQKAGNGFALAILGRDGMPAAQTIPIPESATGLFTPRWSPDDRSVAFSADERGFRSALHVIDVAGGSPKVIARAGAIDGHAWLPDGSGLVYASSSGSTMVYPPIMNLRMVSRDGVIDRQLTVGDASYVQPDVVQAGRLFASRVRLQSDIWAFPVSGSPGENVRDGVRITRQSGQVQTPSASPDGKEIAYLSDNGGHGNVWVAAIDGSGVRQLTFERNPDVLIGVPIWSPAGDRIVFVRNTAGVNSEWLINPDGSGLRQLVSPGSGAAWSADGRWLYYTTAVMASEKPCIQKIPSDGSTKVQVRCNAAGAVPSSDEKTLYYTDSGSRNASAIFKAVLPDGEGVAIARYPSARVPAWPTGFALSPDDRWLAVPLKDGDTTNIWVIPTAGGPFRQLTDFGRRAILIARQVSWSADGRTIYAAVVENDADIVLLDGMVP